MSLTKRPRLENAKIVSHTRRLILHRAINRDSEFPPKICAKAPQTDLSMKHEEQILIGVRLLLGSFGVLADIWRRLASKALVHTVVLARVTQASLYQTRVVEACARRIGIHDADLDHDHFSAFHFARVARPYFTGSSLILSPPFATGMTQMGVATSAELSSDI
jgi:hypothetical protein